MTWPTLRSRCAALLSLAVAACSSQRGVPKAYGPLALAKGDACPDVTGRYAYTGEPGGFLLAARHGITYENLAVEHFTVTGDADTALRLRIGRSDGSVVEKRLKRGAQPYGGDYWCEDGWLRLGGDIGARWDSTVNDEGFHARRHAVHLATGREGALVTKLDHTDYDEFTVWCGDGCKGIPLPWTFRTRTTWHRAEAWPEGAPRPVAIAEVMASERKAQEIERARNDPLFLENDRLERGETTPASIETRRRVEAVLPKDIRLLAVAPRDSGWALSIEYDDEAQLPGFLVALQESGPVVEVRRDGLVRGITPERRKTGAVYVRWQQHQP
jgi:hypothetical protein